MDDYTVPPPPPPTGEHTGPHDPPPPPPSEFGAQPPAGTQYAPVSVPGGSAGGTKGSNKKMIIIVLVVVSILLCCCVTAAGGLLFLRGDFASWTTSEDEPAEMSTVTGPAQQATGAVLVWLEWDEPVDLDLEIWDASGDEYLTNASFLIGDDMQTGGSGYEYFEFKDYGTEDYSAGEYVVSVYFAGFDSTDRPAEARLTIQTPSGQLATYSRTVLWDPAYDQWHVVRVEPGTGRVTEIDRFAE